MEIQKPNRVLLVLRLPLTSCYALMDLFQIKSFMSKSHEGAARQSGAVEKGAKAHSDSDAYRIGIVVPI